MGGKMLPFIIIAVIIMAVVVGVFALNLNKWMENPNQQSPDTSVTEVNPKVQPEFMVSQALDEESDENDKTVIISISAKDSPVEISKVQLLEYETKKVISETEDFQDGVATINVSENGKYIVRAHGVNERTFDKSITVSSIPEKRRSEPYLLEGFTAVDDSIGPDDGFVVKDRYGNQYVWIPVETGKLISGDFENKQLYDDDFENLGNSVAKYYGFYISRFEATQFEHNGNYSAASMAGKMPWTNITQTDAVQVSKNVADDYGYQDSSTTIVNSRAWMTMLKWIDTSVEGFSQNTTLGNYDDELAPTGATSRDKAKNICDLSGNVREWTSLQDLTKRVVDEEGLRKNSYYTFGGYIGVQRTPAGFQSIPEDSSKSDVGFRYILFKN